FSFRVGSTTALYTLSLHDALPIWIHRRDLAVDDPVFRHRGPADDPLRHALPASFPGTSRRRHPSGTRARVPLVAVDEHRHGDQRSEEHTSELQSRENLVCRLLLEK